MVNPWTIKLVELKEEFGIRGPDLLSREIGQKFYERLVSPLRALPEGGVLIVDFTGIKVVDTSFADETVLRLLRELLRGDHGDKFLVLHSPSENTIVNLEGTIARKRLRVGFFATFPAGGWTCIGRYDPEDVPDEPIERLLYQVLKRIVKKKGLTARELADAEGLELNTASTRLKKLYDGRLVRREEVITPEGKYFVYKPLQ